MSLGNEDSAGELWKWELKRIGSPTDDIPPVPFGDTNVAVESVLGSSINSQVYQLEGGYTMKLFTLPKPDIRHQISLFLNELRSRRLHETIEFPANVQVAIEANDRGVLMQYFEGEPWRSHLLSLSAEQQVYEFHNTLVQVLDVLEFFEKHGIVHRDIKPSNLLRQKDGTVVVMDSDIMCFEGESIPGLNSYGTESFMLTDTERDLSEPARDLYALAKTIEKDIVFIRESDLNNPKTKQIFLAIKRWILEVQSFYEDPKASLSAKKYKDRLRELTTGLV